MADNARTARQTQAVDNLAGGLGGHLSTTAGLFEGARMWLPCEVKPGPFPDERMVLVKADGSEWFGFVNVRWLKNSIEDGANDVLARVVNIEGPIFSALIPGNAPNSGLFEGRVDRAVPCGSLEA